MYQNGDAMLLKATTHDGADGAAESLRSLSSMTEISGLSSMPSTDSSKATTPVEPKGIREQRTDDLGHPGPAPSYCRNFERLTFNVRPKSSIPNDIPSYQYAGECIAAAEASRLNPYALHPEEYHLLRHHISHTQVTTYLNLRNGILRLWLRQPWTALNRQEAVGCANARWFDAANVCYDWLVRRGYLNYGCVAIPEPQKQPSSSRLSKKQKTILVIGAGISGLGCARQLEYLFKQYADQFREIDQEPPKVIVLEGRDRVGGRVYSRELNANRNKVQSEFAGKRHTAEMGGMIITGFERGNPMNILVRGQLGLPCHALTADTTIFDSSGKPVDPERDLLVEKLYNDCLDRVSEFKYKSRPSKLIEGNHDLIDEGRDSPGDGSKTIIQAEEATAALPDAPPVSEQNVPEKVNLVPVSSDRITGRVHNQPGVPAIIKASDKARLMGWTLRAGSHEEDNIDLSGAAEEPDATLGSVLDHAISRYKRLVDLMPQDYRLINWHIANLEYSNATSLRNLSLPLWDIDAGFEWEGQHTMVVGGYQSVARGLLKCPSPLDLRAKLAVRKIKYSSVDFSEPAAVECEDGSTFEADAIVCTVPLGVLKQKSITFDPPLPSWKEDVIGRLGFGILNKIVLVYDKIFWEADRDIFGVLRDAANRHSTSQKDYSAARGRFFQWFNVSKTSGLPCLIALMAGDAGYDTEHTSNDTLIAEATALLRDVFGKDVPFPVEAVVTRWGSDRFARGSYSSAAPSMRPDDYEVMSRPIGNLFFGGEHTIGTHPATVHGAYLSGLRASSEVLEAIIGPIEVPTPLILPRDSLLLHKRKLAAADPHRARLEAYEAEVADYIRSKIGERPVRPSKYAGNAYILFTKAKFDEARAICEAMRKPNKARTTPNEVRMMLSKMWKEVSAEDRKPFEERASDQKKQYLEQLDRYVQASETWDREARALRATYELEHPSAPSPDEFAPEKAAQKHRRLRTLTCADPRDQELAL